MTNLNPVAEFQRLLKENGLQVSLAPPKIEITPNGRIIIDPPQLVVVFTPDKPRELENTEISAFGHEENLPVEDINLIK